MALVYSGVGVQGELIWCLGQLAGGYSFTGWFQSEPRERSYMKSKKSVMVHVKGAGLTSGWLRPYRSEPASAFFGGLVGNALLPAGKGKGRKGAHENNNTDDEHINRQHGAEKRQIASRENPRDREARKAKRGHSTRHLGSRGGSRSKY